MSSLKSLIKKDYDDANFTTANKVIFEHDEYLSQIMKRFYDIGIKTIKGSFFYSIHYTTNAGLKYLEGRGEFIDEKIRSEFCLFILNMVATSAGVKLGNHKEQYQQISPPMNDLIIELQRGI